MRAFTALLARDLTLAFRVGGGAFTGVLFFLTVVTVIPFAVGPDLNLLSRIGPAILWIGALLATLLGLDRLFQSDKEDGTLDVLAASGEPLMLIVLAKLLAHWLATSLPLVVATPVLSLFVALEPKALAALVATLLVGTPALAALGAVGAALSVALRRGGLLMAVVVLPLAIPVLIFGVSATNAAILEPDPFLPPFLILCALTLVYGLMGPLAAAALLKHPD